MYSVPRYGSMWGNGGLAPRILELDGRWKWVVNFILLPLYPWPCESSVKKKREPDERGWEASGFLSLIQRKSLSIYPVADWMRPIVQTWMIKKRKFLLLPGTELQSSRVKSLYSLNCRNSFFLLLPPNILKPTGHVMHQQFNIQQMYVLPTLYLSENKQRLVPLTA